MSSPEFETERPGFSGDAPTPEIPPRFPPWRIRDGLAVVAIFALAQVGVSLGLGVTIQTMFPATKLLDRLWIGLPVTLAASHLVAWLAIYYLVARRHAMVFFRALRMERYPGRPVARSFFGGMATQLGVVVLAVVFPPPEDFRAPLEEFFRAGAMAVATLFVIAVILAPLLEEAIFRGLLFPALRSRYGFTASALTVTVLFAALHATQTGSYWPALAGIALCGYFLAFLRERSGSLWPSVAFHAGFNFTAFIPVLILGSIPA